MIITSCCPWAVLLYVVWMIDLAPPPPPPRSRGRKKAKKLDLIVLGTREEEHKKNTSPTNNHVLGYLSIYMSILDQGCSIVYITILVSMI